ncbi:MAG: prepilin-type N-terminal cleavage/methylation domain-containing protein [Ruminococcus sp.]|nr:prepilin-type N-terminal cleavage/methylation domain-containing protein [Ruminococcus sp.]
MNIGKKSNKNGFTLVELIVVVVIFGMIMGAILNFMKPANEIHNDTQATMDANVISSGLIEYMDDELRYATNVLVLNGYMGVPKVSESGMVGNYPVSFTDCLVIDNFNPRGYTNKNFNPSADDTPTRLGCRGSIIKVSQINTKGFDFNNSKIVKGADFYDKFTYSIKIGSNVLDKEFEVNNQISTLQVSLVAYQPVYKNGRYVFTKKKFDRDTKNGEDGTIEKNKGAVLSLTNINIDPNDSAKLVVCENGLVNPVQIIGKFENDGYPTQTTAPVGATSYQQEIYKANRQISITDTNGEDQNVVPRYTYIFYRKNKSATKCSVNFKFSETSPITPGEDVGDPYNNVAKGTTFKNFPPAPSAPSGYNAPYWQAPDGSIVDKNVGYAINGDTTFTLVYSEKAPSPNEVTLTWLKQDGSVYATTKQDKATGSETVTATPPAGDPVNTEFNDYEWVEYGTGAKLADVNVNGEKTFYPSVTPKPVVKFSTDGTNVDSEIRVSKGQKIPEHKVPLAVAARIPSDKDFDKWVLKDDTSKDVESTVIQADCMFVGKFKEKSSSGGGGSSSNGSFVATIDPGNTHHEKWSSDLCLVGINVTNTSASTANCTKYLVLTFTSNVKNMNWWYGEINHISSATISGKTIRYPINDTFNAGEGKRIYLQVYPSNTNDSGFNFVSATIE